MYGLISWLSSFSLIFTPIPLCLDYCSLKPSSVSPLTLFFLNIILAILGPLHFHIHFRIKIYSDTFFFFSVLASLQYVEVLSQRSDLSCSHDLNRSCGNTGRWNLCPSTPQTPLIPVLCHSGNSYSYALKKESLKGFNMAMHPNRVPCIQEEFYEFMFSV